MGLFDYLFSGADNTAQRSNSRYIANNPQQLIPPSNVDPNAFAPTVAGAMLNDARQGNYKTPPISPPTDMQPSPSGTPVTVRPPDIAPGALAPAPALPTGYGLGQAFSASALRGMVAQNPTPYGTMASPVYQAVENFDRGMRGAAPYIPPVGAIAAPMPAPAITDGSRMGRGLPATGLPAMNADVAANAPVVAPAALAARRGPSFGPLSIMQLQALAGFLPRQPMPQELAQRELLTQATGMREAALAKATTPEQRKLVDDQYLQMLHPLLYPGVGTLESLQDIGQTGGMPK